jgi:Rrf2 family nitric oxide-sensitive transcriptional repressor
VHLTLFTDYALRSLLYLSWHAERPCTAEEIAGFFHISQDHVTKVVQHLVHKGYVRSRRGRKGGAQLARPPQDVRLGQVVRDFEQVALLDCLVHTGVCVIEGDCRLQQVLAEGQRRLLAYFDEFTLADLAGPAPPEDLPAGGRRPLPVRPGP